MKTVSKAEAARLLGCTERQIQRLAKAGKLSVEYKLDGKARKAVYVEAELKALKQQQEAPELRGIAVRPTEPTTNHQPPTTISNVQSPMSNPIALPLAAQQVLQMLGATAGVEERKCVSVEELKFDKLSVGADGTTRMSGVSVSRYSARA